MTDEPLVDPLVQMKSLNQSQLSSVIANLLNAHPELSAEVMMTTETMSQFRCN